MYKCIGLLVIWILVILFNAFYPSILKYFISSSKVRKRLSEE